MMCQHFTGHKVKQLLAAVRNLRATHNRWRNGAARDCKRLQYTQISPV
jgi:hypothetical protein